MINETLSASLKNIKRDALAGTITGLMAVPLTVGICLMSDYPVMTGLYTVIFAGIVSFVTYLFKPGNYTGMPGVAAGLAPALALGVHTFGMENMPFVILLTALFQALVWSCEWERYILRIVPHYLVEGLLAGIGLKIVLKFIPFLYDIEHETDQWLNLERELVLILSLVSFVSFVLLYKYYKKRLPALPYVLIMLTGFALSFVMPLPRISIETIPFELAVPTPNLSGLSSVELAILFLKMTGYAIMLGTIDVIEQVMSNVAIEKMDPKQRKTNTNNSLLAIWIANLGATFFGGMTNLDGLAKSTTNTVAGAVTKLSNVFTSGVLLLVVSFPIILAHLPEYALGIIMVYSGWKMIANLANVRSEGRYALIMAGICGLLVFELGIFEGLLLLLIVHAAIQFVFMRKTGKSSREIWQFFLKTGESGVLERSVERADMIDEPHVPILRKWITAFNSHDLDNLMKIYHEDAVFIPTLAQASYKKDQISQQFSGLFDQFHPLVSPGDIHTQRINGLKVDSGHYYLQTQEKGHPVESIVRFSFVIKYGKILTHHESIDPAADAYLIGHERQAESTTSGR